MNYQMIGKIIAPLLGIEALFMIPAWLLGLYYQEANAANALGYSICIILVIASCIYLLTRNAKRGFYAKEGMVTTGLAWILMSALGCLPFFLSKEIPNYVDALFEMVSGFTTTGSSILTNVEGMSKCLLYWRSFSHWLGGMGVLVFLMAIVPLAKSNEGYTLHLLRAESPGPSVGKLVSKMKKSASILYWIYIGLTILNFIFLILGKMPVFDAVCTAYGTAGTGGFGIKNDSMASYSPYLQNVTTVFMILFGVNFSCFYLLLLKEFKAVFEDEELRLYLAFIFGSILLIGLDIRHLYPSLQEAFHQASFQVGSIITTTGFATCNFDLWPSFSKTILLFLMISGACAGSTGGGLKVIRILLLEKSMRRNFRKNLRVHEVKAIRVNHQVVDEKVMQNVNAYLVAYVTIIIVSILLLSLDGFPIETNLSAVLATFNNIGPGLNHVGPSANFACYSNFSKIIMIIDMLAGRLEIFPIMMLFSKRTWKK